MICQNKKRFQAKWFDEFLTIRLGQCIEPSEWVTTAVVTHFEDFLIFSETLFKNKNFLLDEIFQQNTSKFVPFFFLEYPDGFFYFVFHFVLYFMFSLMNALVYVKIGQGIHSFGK